MRLLMLATLPSIALSMIATAIPRTVTPSVAESTSRNSVDQNRERLARQIQAEWAEQKKHAGTVTKWCHDWSNSAAKRMPYYAAVDQRSRVSVPFMIAMTDTRRSLKEEIQEKIRSIRLAMSPHRDARRELRTQLAQVEDARKLWETVCEGEQCELHDQELAIEITSLRDELQGHHDALQVLDYEQRELLRGGDEQYDL